MKTLMLHPKKKSMTKEEEREIRYPISLLPLIMITCLPLAPSPRYPLLKSQFRWDGLYQIEVLDEDASNLAQSERFDYYVHMC
jgi:hypothetical protein